MLYVVTTTYFDGAPTIGVFVSYELALEAIKAFVRDEQLEELDGDGGEYYAYAGLGRYVTFYIEQCYLNTSLV